MDTPQLLVSVVLAVSCSLVTSDNGPLFQTRRTCLNVTLLDFQGQDYTMHDLCVASGNRVTVVLRCVAGSRSGREVSLNPCVEGVSAATLPCDSPGHVSVEVRTKEGEEGGEVKDIAHHTLLPSQETSRVLRVMGHLRETRFTVAVTQDCTTPEVNVAKLPVPGSRLTETSGTDVPVASWDALPRHPRQGSSRLTQRRKRDVKASREPVEKYGALPSSVDRLNFDSPALEQDDNILVRSREITKPPFHNRQEDSFESEVTGEENVSMSDSTTKPENGGLTTTAGQEEKGEEQNTKTSAAPSEAGITTKPIETSATSNVQNATNVKRTSASVTLSASSSTSTSTAATSSSTTDSKPTISVSPDVPISITASQNAKTTLDNNKPHQTSDHKRNQTTETATYTTDSVTTTSDIPTEKSGSQNPGQSMTHTKPSEPKDTSPQTDTTTLATKLSETKSSVASTHVPPTKPVPVRTPSAILYSTLEVVTRGNSSGLAQDPNSSSTSEEDEDTFWPIVAALVVGIPSIIVFGIAIIVVHRRRRVASPSRRLRAASLYPS